MHPVCQQLFVLYFVFVFQMVSPSFRCFSSSSSSLFFFGMAQNTGPYLLKIAVNWPFHRVGICLHVRTASI